MRKSLSPKDYVLLAILTLLWGANWPVMKLGVAEFPPLFFLALRFLAIALLLVPFVKKPTRQQFGPVAAISLFLGGLNFGLFYVGLGLGSGSISAVAYQLAPPFTVLLAWPLPAERPSLVRSAGVVLAFAGVVVLAAGRQLPLWPRVPHGVERLRVLRRTDAAEFEPDCLRDSSWLAQVCSCAVGNIGNRSVRQHG